MSLRLTPARRAGFAVAAGALLAAAVGAPASAAPGLTDEATTTADVVVQSAISLTGLTTDFTLTGIPGGTVELLDAVDFTVETNNFAGYTVSVTAQAPTLAATAPTNADSIPVNALGVRESGTTTYTPLSSTTPVTVHSQSTRSAASGDALSNDYQVVIPFVNEDTYTVDLDYVATTL